MILDAKSCAKILKSVNKLVVAHHINIAGIDYKSWTAQMDARTPELLDCEIPAFEFGVRQLLTELKTSHTLFYHSIPRELLPQHTINASLREVALNGDRRWMFLDVFEAGPAHRVGIKPGDILETLDDALTAPPKLPQFGIGRRHKLRIRNAGDRGRRELTIDVPMRKGTKQRPPMVEPKSPIHAMIEPRIGLLRIPYFPGSVGMGFADELDSAVDDLKRQGCDRLIIDLRGNIGGSLGFARLASYMCPDQIPIGHSLTPKRRRSGYDPEKLPRVPMPSSRSELVVTLGKYVFRDKSVMLLTQGLGPQPFHGRMVLLINEWTNSAAEMLANFAVENNLTKTVGHRTRGNVLGAANFKLDAGYWLRLPVFGWFSSKGRTIEGRGVEPDFAVEISPEALNRGEDNQLTKAIEIVRNA
jgi:C-terminal processing protease CtpA/Prc